MKVGYANLKRFVDTYKKDIDSAIAECLHNSWYIKGPAVKTFEDKLAKYCNNSAATCSSGTSALLMAYEQVGIGPGDKVIVPSWTFISTAEMITKLGATPVWVDANMHDYTIDIEDLERKMDTHGKDIKAIVGVDCYGHTCDWDKIKEIADAYFIPVIQDAAQSFGGEYKGQINGSYNLTCFSFYPSKNLFCLGDGGAVTGTQLECDQIRMRGDHGRTSKWEHEFCGCNERLDSIQANILNRLIKYTNKFNKERIKIAKIYNDNLVVNSVPQTADWCTHVFNQYTILVNNRDELFNKLADKGIGCGKAWPRGLHQQECYADSDALCPNTEILAEEIISLPCYPGLTETEQAYVIEQVNALS